MASAASVRDPDQASGVVERCLAEFGRVDGLVNNAALNYQALPWPSPFRVEPADLPA